MIAKILSSSMKVVLSKSIFMEQFGFLTGRSIHDAIGYAREALHSIKIRKCCAIILKMDLVKAYERVNWSFLWFLLLHIGIDGPTTNWIMGCISSANFAVLINGVLPAFFSFSHRLR